MIATARDWLNRNRNRFAVGAGILSAGYLAGQYTLGKINDARQRMSDDRIARENLRRRFTQNQEDCTYTILALLPTATEHILDELPVERITAELQARKADKLSRSAGTSELAPSEVASNAGDTKSNGAPANGSINPSQTSSSAPRDSDTQQNDPSSLPSRSKVQLWDQLKVASIVRAITLIYSLALLTVFTRIQLNLLGRRNYLSSVVSLATAFEDGPQKITLENREDDVHQAYGSDFNTNRKYLTFSWWLLHRGWKDIKDGVERAVIDEFGVLTPRDSITLGKLSRLILSVRKRVEGFTDEDRSKRKWLQYLLPTKDKEEEVLKESGVLRPHGADSPYVSIGLAVNASLRRLLDETSDLVDSPAFTHVLTLVLDAAFSLLVDEKVAVQAYRLPLQSRQFPIVQHEHSAQGRITELGDDENMENPEAQCKLATILAVLTRQAHAIGAGALIDSAGIAVPGTSQGSVAQSNEYLKAMEKVRDLEAFAAVVYSSNFEYEGSENNGSFELLAAEPTLGGTDGVA